jgi:crotonobetainyl-CoA:carnitine CoA-transferase CaiB-like acyl-CoA transferase
MADALPLAGVRILELGAYISGPYAGGILSGLGADVVKVEPPGGGDAFRRGLGSGSPYFAQYNAGKRSIAIDLKKPDGIALVKALLPRFDVVIENSRPGKIEQLGLGADDCKAINPKLIYASVSGFGDSGPMRDRAAYDSIGQSISGFYSIMNEPEQARLSGTCVGDLVTGMVNAMGILAGLVGRGHSGNGTVVRTSLLEAMSTITIDAITQYYETGASPTRQTRHPQAQNFCLLTSSGESITLHLSSSEKFWRCLVSAMDRPDLLDDPRFTRYADRHDNFWDLKAIVEGEFRKRSRSEWEQLLTAEDVPFAPVFTVENVVEDAQTRHLGLIETARDGHVLVRPPWRIDEARPHRAEATPVLGEHTVEIAREVLGEREIADLLATKVIVQAADPATTRNAPVRLHQAAV